MYLLSLLSFSPYSFTPNRNLKTNTETIAAKSKPITKYLEKVPGSSFSAIDIKVTKTGTIDYHIARR
jgi:hypothetical protein